MPSRARELVVRIGPHSPPLLVPLPPNITSLFLGSAGPIPDGWASVIPQLPHLISLSLAPGSESPVTTLFATPRFSFGTLTRLRHLRLVDHTGELHSRQALPASLTSLHLVTPTIVGDLLVPETAKLDSLRFSTPNSAQMQIPRSLEGSPLARQLESLRSLSLDFFAFAAPAYPVLFASTPGFDAQELRSMLRLCTQLEELELSHISSVSWISPPDLAFPSVRTLRLEGNCNLAHTSQFSSFASFLCSFPKLETVHLSGFSYITTSALFGSELPTLRFDLAGDALPLAVQHPVLNALVRLLEMLPVLHMRIRATRESRRVILLRRGSRTIKFRQENLVDLAV
ncbi:hypothetical protein JCM10908_004829 [Rhodotorula pacifica]|uniref:uncharacterized protein n=1 Tax=Rhodotorula pacifica TaxID=1495444 RepID=UPI00317454C2